MLCKHCQQEMKLRSFRPPPNLCANCGKLQAPDLPRSIRGRLFLFPVAILSAVTFGWIGLAIGRLLAPALNFQDLDKLLAFIAGADGIGIVIIIYDRKFRDPAERHFAKPLLIFLTFALVGEKCVRGMGINAFLIAGTTNAVLASIVTAGILKLFPLPTVTSPKTE